MEVILGILGGLCVPVVLYVVYRIVTGLLTFQIDEEWKCNPEKEGWCFSVLPRRVENQTVFFKYFYYKKWVDRGYDGDLYFAYVKYYMHNPNYEVNEDE